MEIALELEPAFNLRRHDGADFSVFYLILNDERIGIYQGNQPALASKERDGARIINNRGSVGSSRVTWLRWDESDEFWSECIVPDIFPPAAWLGGESLPGPSLHIFISAKSRDRATELEYLLVSLRVTKKPEEPPDLDVLAVNAPKPPADGPEHRPTLESLASFRASQRRFIVRDVCLFFEEDSSDRGPTEGDERTAEIAPAITAAPPDASRPTPPARSARAKLASPKPTTDPASKLATEAGAEKPSAVTQAKTGRAKPAGEGTDGKPSAASEGLKPANRKAHVEVAERKTPDGAQTTKVASPKPANEATDRKPAANEIRKPSAEVAAPKPPAGSPAANVVERKPSPVSLAPTVASPKPGVAGASGKPSSETKVANPKPASESTARKPPAGSEGAKPASPKPLTEASERRGPAASQPAKVAGPKPATDGAPRKPATEAKPASSKPAAETSERKPPTPSPRKKAASPAPASDAQTSEKPASN